MPFTITGNGADGLHSATRTSPASAIVLALRWAGNGLTDVQIAPPDQGPLCFRIFQRQRFESLLHASEPHENQPRPRLIQPDAQLR
jgi:hypothetical protein